jgi:hypothetical protein
MYIFHHVVFSQWHMQHTLHSELTLKIFNQHVLSQM